VSARSKARKRALDVLYASELRGESATEALDRAKEEGEGPTNEYTSELVRGVEDYREDLDILIGETATGWTVDRMAAVDRAILRLATHELLHVPETPVAVAIDEAVEAANELSTEDSGRFVNGVLGRIASEREVLALREGGRGPVSD